MISSALVTTGTCLLRGRSSAHTCQGGLQRSGGGLSRVQRARSSGSITGSGCRGRAQAGHAQAQRLAAALQGVRRRRRGAGRLCCNGLQRADQVRRTGRQRTCDHAIYQVTYPLPNTGETLQDQKPGTNP